MRFTEIVSTERIRDNVTGREYHGLVDDEFLELINKESERADRNAELLDVDCVAQYNYCKKVRRIMRKYEIDNLEKLDRILFEKGVW